MIRIQGLIKDYRTGFRGPVKRALNGLDLSVNPGETVALIGPNGAGKTTTIRILFGLIQATAGSVSVFGLPGSDPAWRARSGYLSEFFKPPVFYTGHDFIRLMGRVQGTDDAAITKRIAELSEVLDLRELLPIKIGRYSRGMMQKIGLAQALINDPELLVLDEPTANLDAVVRTHFKELLAARKKQGKSLLISSHVLSELEQLADRVSFIFEGRVREESVMSELGAASKIYDLAFSLPDPTAAASWNLPGTTLVLPKKPGEPIRLAADGEEAKDQAAQKILASGGRLIYLSPRHKSLEQQFLEWIGDRS